MAERDHPVNPLALCAAAGLAAYTGVQIAGGAPREQVVLPLAAAGAVLLAHLAVTRFGTFVLAVLVLRTALDAAKLSGGLDVTRETGASGLLDPGALLGVIFTIAGIAWLAVQGRRAPSPLGITGVALAGAAALSAVGARQPATSAAEVVRLAAVAVMLLVVERLVADDPRRRIPLLTAMFAAAVAPVLFTVYQAVSGDGLVDVHGMARAHGTFWHPNVLGVFAALLLVLAIALLTGVRGEARTGLALLACGLGFALVASSSRGAWLAALAGLVVVALLRDRRILLVLGAATTLVALVVPSVTERFTGPAPPGTESSLDWRFGQWRQALGLLGDNPVTGIGPGMARVRLGKEIHNDYLRALVETGLVGFIVYLALLVALALTARRALRAATGPLDRGIAVGLAGCTAALATFAAADNVMTSVVVLWYLAALAALAGQPDRELAGVPR